MRDQLENSTLLSKTKEAGRQLSEAFRNEFLSLLVHAFSKIRDTRDDPPPILRRKVHIPNDPGRTVFVDHHPNWTMPALSMLGDDSEEGLAIRTIADMSCVP
jgi:hypothetical protein